MQWYLRRPQTEQGTIQRTSDGGIGILVGCSRGNVFGQVRLEFNFHAFGQDVAYILALPGYQRRRGGKGTIANGIVNLVPEIVGAQKNRTRSHSYSALDSAQA